LRIIPDQNRPERVGRDLVGHEVTTARQMVWSDLTNGDLLSAAEANGFDVSLTADKRIRYQQSLAERRIALPALSLNSLAVLLQHLGLMQSAVDRAGTGTYEKVDIPCPRWSGGHHPALERGCRTLLCC
jgi:hypothetical protein